MSQYFQSFDPSRWHVAGLFLVVLGTVAWWRRPTGGDSQPTPASAEKPSPSQDDSCSRMPSPPETSGGASTAKPGHRVRFRPTVTLGGGSVATFVCFLMTLGILRLESPYAYFKQLGSIGPSSMAQSLDPTDLPTPRGGDAPAGGDSSSVDGLDLEYYDLHDKRSADHLRLAWKHRHGSLKDQGTALANLDRVIELESDSPPKTRARLLLLRGQLLADMGRHHDAALALEGALELGYANHALLIQSYERALLAPNLGAEEAEELRSRKNEVEALRQSQVPTASPVGEELPIDDRGAARNPGATSAENISTSVGAYGLTTLDDHGDLLAVHLEMRSNLKTAVAAVAKAIYQERYGSAAFEPACQAAGGCYDRTDARPAGATGLPLVPYLVTDSHLAGGSWHDALWKMGANDPQPSPPPPTGSVRNPSRSLVVGIDDYVDWDFGPLDYGASDARSIAQALTGLGYEGQLLLNGDATRHRILAQLREEVEKSRAGDQAVIYFAGHGFADADGRQAIVTSDGFALALEEIEAALELHRGEVTVLFDSCFNVRELPSERFHVAGPVTDLTDTGGNLRFYLAGAAGQTALESHRLGGGLFTHAVLEALAVLPASGGVTGNDLAAALAGVADATGTLAFEMYGAEQVPATYASAYGARAGAASTVPSGSHPEGTSRSSSRAPDRTDDPTGAMARRR